MSKNNYDVNKSLVLFRDELSKKISLLEERIDGVDDKRDDLRDIEVIVDSYTSIPINSLIGEDLFYFKPADIYTILDKCGVSEEVIKEIMANFGKIVKDYQFSNSKTKIKEAEDFLNIIANYMRRFFNEVNSMTSAQIEILEDEIDEFKKYVDIINSKHLKQKFEDIEELERVLSKANISAKDRGNIHYYVAKENMEFKNNKISGALKSDILNCANDYLNDNNVALKPVKTYLNSMAEIDIDIIEDIAQEISDINKLDFDLVVNTICALIIYSYYNKLTNENDYSNRRKYLENIKLTSNHIKDVSFDIERIARLFVQNNKDRYEQYKSLSNCDVNEFISKTIEEIKEEYNVDDITAINFKMLPISNAVSTTLDTIDSIDKSEKEEEYNECCSILQGLLEQGTDLEGMKHKR